MPGAFGDTYPPLAPSSYLVAIDAFEASVSIDHHYALTTVREVLSNPSTQLQQYQVNIASSELAFITRFALEVNGSTFEAKIEDASEARTAYNTTVEAGWGAALIETRDSKVTHISVGVPANSTVVVHLAFEEMVYRAHGAYSYKLPLVDALAGRAAASFTLEGRLTGSQNITSKSLTLGVLTKDSSKDFAFGFTASAYAPNRDLFVNWTEEEPSGAGSLLTHSAADGTVYFIHLFSPDGAGLSLNPVPKDIVFVIDNSGSMSGTKIVQARQAFKALCLDLLPGDRFTVLAFDDRLDWWNATLQDVTPETVAAAGAWIDKLSGRGSTDINASLQAGIHLLAGSGQTPIIVFLSDGEATHGESRPGVIRSNLRVANSAGASVFTLAFGPDADWTLMQQLAFENNGSARRIAPAADAAEQIRGFYLTFSAPALSDVEFLYGETVAWAGPRAQGNAYGGSNLMVVGKLVRGATAIDVEVRGTAANGPVSFNASFTVEGTEAGAFVERAWAFERIRQLEREVTLGNASAKGELVGLALEYRFVTPYTSLVAVQGPAQYLPTSAMGQCLCSDGATANVQTDTWFAGSPPSVPPTQAAAASGRPALDLAVSVPPSSSAALAGASPVNVAVGAALAASLGLFAVALGLRIKSRR